MACSSCGFRSKGGLSHQITRADWEMLSLSQRRGCGGRPALCGSGGMAAVVGANCRVGVFYVASFAIWAIAVKFSYLPS